MSSNRLKWIKSKDIHTAELDGKPIGHIIYLGPKRFKWIFFHKNGIEKTLLEAQEKFYQALEK